MFGLFKSKEQKGLELLANLAQSNQSNNPDVPAFMTGITPTGNIQLKVGNSTITMDAQTVAFLITQLAACLQGKYQIEVKEIIQESKND
jgi:hypothetical protein